jgi:hypothetical protein
MSSVTGVCGLALVVMQLSKPGSAWPVFVLAVAASVAAYLFVTQHALLHQPLSFYFTDPFATHSQSLY